MRVRALGTLELVVDGRSVPLGGHRQRCVLALLAMSHGHVVPVERLVDQVWNGEPPASAQTTLQGYVKHLRKALAGSGVAIETRSPGYVLVIEPDDLDVVRFERLLAEAGRALASEMPAVAARSLREALSLWRGPAWADFAYEPFAEGEIARLEELHLTAVEQRIAADLACGRHQEVVGELEKLVAAHPLREALCGQLMVALNACGRRAEALRAFQEARHRLGEELGLDPGPELRRIEEAILLEDPTIEPVADAGPEPLGNLPPDLTTFVGRARELAEVAALVDRHRLVTLTGAGGSGKTRLALRAARDVAAAGHAVWLVDLAPVTDPSFVARTVAAVLGAREEPDRTVEDVIVDALRRRDSLLVLDNCEHVLEPVAELLARVLPACPLLRVLATSREPLDLSGELAWRVPTLPVPDDSWNPAAVRSSDAVALFLARASTAVPGYEPTDADLRHIVDVCRCLDGIPLAIELAAARLRVLTVEQIAARLEDRFRLLVGGSRDAVPRQRTLLAAMEWSHDLLTDDERTVFRRLAGFVGSFTLASAEALCDAGDLLEVLTGLVNKSLVAPADRIDGEARYRLLETVRAYGRDRLRDAGEDVDLARRHAELFAARAAEANEHLRGADARRWLGRLDREEDDNRAALEWLLTHGEPADAARLALDLADFWDCRYRVREGRTWLDRVAERDPSDVLRVRLQVAMADLAWEDDDLEVAAAACEEGLTVAIALGDRWSQGRLRTILAEVVRHLHSDPVRAEQLAREAAATLAAIDDGWGRANALRVLTLLAWDRGDLAAATRHGEECLALWQQAGDLEKCAGAQAMLGGLARDGGDLALATELYERSLADFTTIGEPWGTAHVIRNLGTLAAAQGDHERASRFGEESLQRHEAIGNRRGIAESFKVLADAALERGDLEEAAAMAGTAVARFRERGFVGDLPAALQTLARVALARGDTDAAELACEEALAPYRTTGHTRDAAGALCLLAAVQSRTGRGTDAVASCHEALSLFRAAGDDLGAARCYEVLAEVAVTAGTFEQAAGFLSAAQTARSCAAAAPLPSERPDHVRLLHAVRAGLGDTEFAQAWAWDAEVIDLREPTVTRPPR